ncbi:MAG TPA: MFS transporter [Acidimicrobiales bacterium]|nr:MFS transporter [Acidimicrobiales bacterium]
MEPIRYGSAAGRWVVAATVLGSGIAFLDGTVVNVALPAIARDLHADVRGLQWILDAYLVTLSALLLLGGTLGDLYGRRRVFLIGLGWFVAASLLCGLAPSTGALVAARALQGLGGALLVPGSLALLSAVFVPEDRSKAVGAWSGLAGVASALGPFVGGYLIDAVSWRLIFLINVPLAAGCAWMTVRHVPETRDPAGSRLDGIGVGCVTLGLAALAYALIDKSVAAGVVGGLAMAAFVVVERRRGDKAMLPLTVFRSSQFTGANLTTLAVYAGLGGAFFLLSLHLQNALGYSALEAGTSLLPFTVIMLLASARVGALAQRVGPRLLMTIGPLVAGLGLALLGRVRPGLGYVDAVLPGVLVFGVGMTLTVAPLTSAVLAAADQRHLGVASGFNNAVARVAGLLAVAVLPGLGGGFGRAMRISAAVCALGGVVAWLTVRRAVPVEATTQAAVLHPCHEPCLAETDAA